MIVVDYRVHDEWAIQLHGDTVPVVLYDSYAAAKRTLDHHRTDLRKLNVPEEYWPVLISRSVETLAGSWRQHSD